MTRINTTTGRTLVQNVDYRFDPDLTTWTGWASTAYWYAVGTGRIEHKADTEEYARFRRCMNGMPTDTDIVHLQEWAEHMPTDAHEIAHRAWRGK